MGVRSTEFALPCLLPGVIHGLRIGGSGGQPVPSQLRPAWGGGGSGRAGLSLADGHSLYGGGSGALAEDALRGGGESRQLYRCHRHRRGIATGFRLCHQEGNGEGATRRSIVAAPGLTVRRAI